LPAFTEARTLGPSTEKADDLRIRRYERAVLHGVEGGLSTCLPVPLRRCLIALIASRSRDMLRQRFTLVTFPDARFLVSPEKTTRQSREHSKQVATIRHRAYPGLWSCDSEHC
jgi:hypothetical protein